MNDKGIWQWDADLVDVTGISLNYTLNLNGDVTNTGAGVQEVIQSYSVSDTVTFLRKTIADIDSLADDEWLCLTGGTNVVMGPDSQKPPFFRKTVAEPQIFLTTTKAISGSYTIDPHTTHPDPDDPDNPPIPDPPVDYPFSGTMTIGLAFYKDTLTTGHWEVYFSGYGGAFGMEYNDSFSDPSSTMSVTVDPRTLKVGGSSDFGETWNGTTPSGYGYPGWTVGSWNVSVTAAIHCT